MRVGIFGGTFDPIHYGHLLVAGDVSQNLRLDRLLLVPSRQPPHRRPAAAYQDRLRMTALAARGRPPLEACAAESRLPVPSYTVRTLEHLRRSLPRATLFFIIGSDQYRQMSLWRLPFALTDAVRVVVVDRPGVPRPPVFRGHRRDRVRFLGSIQVDISAGDIRARLARHKSVRYMLPALVEDHIKARGIYS